MQDHEVRNLLRLSLQDGQIDRAERDAFRQWMEESAPDGQKRAVYQSMAFDLAREAIERGTATHYAVLNWLERVVKILTPLAASSSPSVVAEACFSPQHHCAARIVSLFNGAEKSADVCVFTITDDRIASAILGAHRRGVGIRIITDNDKCLDPGSDVERLVQAGIAVRQDNTEFHMHHKFAVFDQKVLLTGSYNWTRSAALHNEENFVLTGDPRLVGTFSGLFGQLWEQFAPGG